MFTRVVPVIRGAVMEAQVEQRSIQSEDQGCTDPGGIYGAVNVSLNQIV